MTLIICMTILMIAFFVYFVGKLITEKSQDYIYTLVSIAVGMIILFSGSFRSGQVSIPVGVLTGIFGVLVPAIMLLLAQKHIRLGELKLIFDKSGELKNECIDIVTKYPNSYLGHKYLAEYYVKHSEFEKAEDEYIKLISLNQKEKENYCELAKVLYKNGKRDDAIQILNDLVSKIPDYYEGSLMLGSLLYEGDNFKEAIAVFNQALKHHPEKFDLYYYLGMSYTRINEFKVAMEYYQKAAKINSVKDISNLNVGQIYMIFEEYDEAEKYFYKMINSDDEVISANAYYYLSKLKLIQGNEQQAIQYANLAIEIDPEMRERMVKDDLFISILQKLRGTSARTASTKLNRQELETIAHLSRTSSVVENLTSEVRFQHQHKGAARTEALEKKASEGERRRGF